MRLSCVSVNGERFFTVEIGLEEDVYSLKKKIKDEFPYPCPAIELVLFLAFKNGEWLQYKTIVKGETINELTKNEDLLIEVGTVGACFVGSDEEKKPVLAPGQVHVLVVALEYHSAGSMRAVKRDLLQLGETIVEGDDEGVGFVMKKQKTDRTSWSCPQITANMIKQLGYKSTYVPWPEVGDVSTERDYPEFKWNIDMSESNPTQVERYKEHLADVLDEMTHLSIKDDLKLDISVGKTQRMLKGKADLCIVPKESFTRNEIVMVIVVKPGSREEALSEANRAQTMGYFLAAHTHFSSRKHRPCPIGLLSNLNDAWCFFG
ncbi:hypothetical protein AeMF1_011982 [Aphanomyces euteiches]|nr:hypothetical protein AeMF1_011982 [Aphanomyces euteiches]KAH9182245.1 hypothetical protein AeNC1_015782 [Aphanomyces euteiches]